MTLEFSIFDNTEEMRKVLERFNEKDASKIARRAMNQSIDRTFTFLDRAIRKRRKLNASVVKKKFISKQKASGRFIADLSGRIKISDRKLSLARFVVGPKTAPRPKLKGIKVKNRRELAFQFIPGRRFKPKGVFLARARGGNVLAFRRTKTGKGKSILRAQRRPSLATLFRSSASLREPVLNFARTFHAGELERQTALMLQNLRVQRPRQRSL